MARFLLTVAQGLFGLIGILMLLLSTYLFFTAFQDNENAFDSWASVSVSFGSLLAAALLCIASMVAYIAEKMVPER